MSLIFVLKYYSNIYIGILTFLFKKKKTAFLTFIKDKQRNNGSKFNKGCQIDLPEIEPEL